MSADEGQSENSELASPIQLFQLVLEESAPTGGTLQKADVTPGSGVQLRCRVNGEIHESEPLLYWGKDGKGLDETDIPGVHTQEFIERLELSLDIDSFKKVHLGKYECNVKRKNGQIQRARLDLQPAPAPFNASSLDLEFCPQEDESFCFHGGVCYRHIKSLQKLCRCRSEFMGPQCRLRTPAVTEEEVKQYLRSTAEHRQGMIALGSVFGAILLLLLIAFFVYARKKRNEKKNERKTKDQEGAGFSNLRPSSNGSVAPSGDEAKHLLEHQISEIPCTRCGYKLLLGEETEKKRTATISRSNSLPASPFVREFYPYDPHCPQCLAEWGNLSYPGPPAPGYQYSFVPLPSNSLQISSIPADPEKPGPASARKERLYGTSSLADTSTDGSPRLSDRSPINRDISTDSSHSHQSRSRSPPTPFFSIAKAKPSRNVRFEDEKSSNRGCWIVHPPMESEVVETKEEDPSPHLILKTLKENVGTEL